MGKNHSVANTLRVADGAKLVVTPYGQANLKAMEKYMAHLGTITSLGYHYLLDGNDAAGNNVWVLPDDGRYARKKKKEKNDKVI